LPQRIRVIVTAGTKRNLRGYRVSIAAPSASIFDAAGQRLLIRNSTACCKFTREYRPQKNACEADLGAALARYGFATESFRYARAIPLKPIGVLREKTRASTADRSSTAGASS